ncbi:MAG: 5-methyltetrahydropteroyltriglutamate--homocysteine S-methyltransferase [Peptoniphilaceae bacterium]|nr:5-methyltetrahydropteroyltriglutamate--homocysteine S-methyltransferase [Peptoniphilaceae bacterium]
MKTSIIGFPRIGENRELKFATEKYFKNKISFEELEETAKEIRKNAWTKQKDSGLDYIVSNDFSYYDLFLDAAVTFNIIPKRYKDLKLDPIDTYFAMARGYQKDGLDVKALSMKKWFNTNYHYMVAEIEDDTEIKLNSTKAFDEYKEAKDFGIETKSTIVGPFTLLKLIDFKGDKGIDDFKNDLVGAYIEYISKFNDLGLKVLQFEEPYIVKDLDSEDIALFKEVYREILANKKDIKILLQTYFGDVRDIYQDLQELDFDGIGLDFIEGRKTLELINQYGFAYGKILFAGLINGKNIWRNSYKKTIEVLDGLRKKGINCVLSTSSSLLHVPYTITNEDELDEKYKKHFAFAYEKLEELEEIKTIADRDYENEEILKRNQDLLANREDYVDESVRERVASIDDSIFTRIDSFEKREEVQAEEFDLPLFPTTTIGSFPQTADVKRNRKRYKNGEITKKEYEEFNLQKIKECIALQEEIGLDVLVHGEFERNDMVEYFGEHLSGYLFTKKAWVQSYGTRCVKPPIIWGDVKRNEPITVKWSTYAQSLTDKPVKGMLTGPVTILNWSFPREDISIQESTYQIALAIRDEVLDLEAASIKVIQIDEAALREKLPLRKTDRYSEYLDWAIPAFRIVHSGCKADTQIHTHMCYSEFGDIIKAIDNMDADVISFEASRSNLKILDFLKENNFKTHVGPGVYDIHSPRVPSVEEITTSLRKMIEKLDYKKLWVNPDCGLKTRGEEETVKALKNLVEASLELRNEYQGKN